MDPNGNPDYTSNLGYATAEDLTIICVPE